MNIFKSLIGVFVATLLLSPGAHAQSPREQLIQMVEQLQKTPTDNELREKIIKLARDVKPAPAVPEEANRAFVRGNVFQKEAKDASGYELAISAYRDALRVAPWWGDAYYNLAVALESAGKFGEAISSLKLYMTSLPAGSPEAREAQNRIYAIEAKSEIATKQTVITARTQRDAKKEQQRSSVEGEWIESRWALTIAVTRQGERFTILPGMVGMLGDQWQPVGVDINPQRVRFGVRQPACLECGVPRYELFISAGGNELTGTFYGTDGMYPVTFQKLLPNCDLRRRGNECLAK